MVYANDILCQDFLNGSAYLMCGIFFQYQVSASRARSRYHSVVPCQALLVLEQIPFLSRPRSAIWRAVVPRAAKQGELFIDRPWCSGDALSKCRHHNAGASDSGLKEPLRAITNPCLAEGAMTNPNVGCWIRCLSLGAPRTGARGFN